MFPHQGSHLNQQRLELRGSSRPFLTLIPSPENVKRQRGCRDGARILSSPSVSLPQARPSHGWERVPSPGLLKLLRAQEWPDPGSVGLGPGLLHF